MPDETPVPLLIVDDDDQVRRMLKRLLARYSRFEVVGEGASGEEALTLVEDLSPQVVLMDMQMPGLTGSEATKVIKGQHPEVKVVALTGNEDRQTVSAMLAAGASGYLLKTATVDEIVSSLDAVVAGMGALSPEVTDDVIEELGELLRREQERANALEELDRMKREFMDVVSHELRTPLTGIKGTIVTLRHRWATVDEPTKLDLIEMMEKQCDRLDRLIRQVLTVSGIQRDDLQSAPSVFGLDSAAREAVESLADRIRNRDVALDLAEVPVRADRALMTEVARSLIENALQFTPGKIVVETRATDIFGELRVTDQGPGLDRDKLDRILGEPFRQGDSSSTREVGGLGVSLFIARRLLEATGGHLGIASDPESGSTFTMALPLEKPPMEA